MQTEHIEATRQWIIVHNDRESGSLGDLHIEYTEEAAKKRFALCTAFLYDDSTATAFVLAANGQPEMVAYAYEGSHSAYGAWFEDGTERHGQAGDVGVEYDEAWRELDWHTVPLDTIDLTF